MRLLRVLLLCGCLLASEAEETAVERKAEKLLQRALQITKGRGGEAAVGFGCGFAAGFACKQVQAMATKAVFAAGILTAGAYYKGYLKDEQLDHFKSKVEGAVEDATAMLPRFLKLADIDGDDKITAADGKMALSKARHCTFSRHTRLAAPHSKWRHAPHQYRVAHALNTAPLGRAVCAEARGVLGRPRRRLARRLSDRVMRGSRTTRGGLIIKEKTLWREDPENHQRKNAHSRMRVWRWERARRYSAQESL